jgi:two-component system sensor histidine kinase AlgZ
VYHGIQPRQQGGTVRLSGRRVPGGVEIEIENPLPQNAPVRRNGHAQENVSRRIAYHFGARAGLETVVSEDRYVVIVRLPDTGAS